MIYTFIDLADYLSVQLNILGPEVFSYECDFRSFQCYMNNFFQMKPVRLKQNRFYYV
jgi:hypothetical protein